MKQLIIILLTLLTVKAEAQLTVADIMNRMGSTGKTAKSFLPRDWKAAHRAAPDFNDDKLPDLIVVAEGNALIEGATSKDQVDMARILLLLAGEGPGYRLLIKQSLTLNCDPPYDLDSISASGDKFTLHFTISTYPDAQGLNLTYRYKTGNWLLSGYSRDYNTGDEVRKGQHIYKIKNTETGSVEEYVLKGKTRTLLKKYIKKDKTTSPLNQLSALDVLRL